MLAAAEAGELDAGDARGWLTRMAAVLRDELVVVGEQRSARTARSTTDEGPSTSGKPCPRLTAPVRTASADISEKTVGGIPARREASGERSAGATMHPTVDTPGRGPC